MFDQFEGKWAVLYRVLGAAIRAILVVALIVMPSVLLPTVSGDGGQVIALVAMFAAALTFFEYVSAYPGLVEFRDAPPFNRIRFGSLFISILLLTVICRGINEPTVVSELVTSIGGLIGYVMDFPYSPVRLIVLALPYGTPPEMIALMRVAAGMSYLISLLSLCYFYVALRVGNWPSKNGLFNVWVNLPTFDPTAGGDVVARLTRDARINIVLGFLLPFVIPAVLHSATNIFGRFTVENYQSLIWTVAAWAFLPSSLFMRGIAMGRVADMISNKRRRTYADTDIDHQPA
ncbi:hypothetical protein [Celeribacter sp.]|uniref:hypothetical protein n=1 Tax=Celeribacter sp. TaxID=1890673 RepID=UPI003A95CD26